MHYSKVTVRVNHLMDDKIFTSYFLLNKKKYTNDAQTNQNSFYLNHFGGQANRVHG